MSLSNGSKAIIALQVAGAAYAVTTLLFAFPGFDFGGVTLFFFGILVAVSAFGFVSGLLFWSGKTAGYYGSIATHALQFPMLISSVLNYKLVFGVGVFLKVVGPIKLVGLNVGASTILIVAPGEQAITLAVNLYALFALAYLIRDRNHSGEPSATDRA